VQIRIPAPLNLADMTTNYEQSGMSAPHPDHNVAPAEAASPSSPIDALNEAAIVAITDARGTIISVNQKFCDISGYDEDELVGQNHRLLKSGAHNRTFFQQLYRTISSGKPWHDTICNRAKAGHLYWVDTTIVPNFSASGTIIGYTAIRFDVTPLKLARQDLWTRAHFDELTGAANRQHFLEKLDGAIATSDRDAFLVAMLDLDHFKEVNDNGGHVVGDQLLRAVSQIVQSHLSPQELLGRLGGDEFAIMLDQQADREALDRRLRNILRAIQAIASSDIEGPRSTASIGLARYPLDGQSTHELIRRADLALYSAKKAGGDDWRAFTLSLEEEEARKVMQRAAFFKAFADGRVQLFYQPVVGLLSLEKPSFEALIRWIQEDGTILTPGSFPELLEDESVAREVGSFALTTALNQIADWNRRGLDFGSIAVNATSSDLRSEAFVTMIADAVTQKLVCPQQLCIEITEGMLIDRQAKRVRAAIDRLHGLGVLIAFDDFGTGFASLTHLRELPINFVKIDRSFIRSLCSNPKDKVIVESVISLAHRLNLGVVAEGVEDQEQRLLLAELGCDRIQGYVISPAIPAEKAGDFLKNIKTDQ
jgi:diguanylate cyclase (GGDEF)-like protein/PAS domain S-box-containing protein